MIGTAQAISRMGLSTLACIVSRMRENVLCSVLVACILYVITTLECE